MGLLISHILGAASAAVLIIVELRRHAGGDTGVADSLGELRGLLDGVSRQQERMVTEATQWNQLLSHAGDRGRWGELTLQNLVEAAGLRERRRRIRPGDTSTSRRQRANATPRQFHRYVLDTRISIGWC